MSIETFQSNVESWAERIGIYSKSTALAQALKANSEAGELCDWTIKGNMDEVKDAIGDTTVCIVNCAKMMDVKIDWDYVLNFKTRDTKGIGNLEAAAVADSVVSEIGLSLTLGFTNDSPEDLVNVSLIALRVAAEVNDLDYLDCCNSAFEVINKRTGSMSAGGAFVKDE